MAAEIQAETVSKAAEIWKVSIIPRQQEGAGTMSKKRIRHRAAG